MKLSKDVEEKQTCVACKKKYTMFMLSDYNLGLCHKCFDKYDKQGLLEHDYGVDKVTHQVTCPLCKAKYGYRIVDCPCETKGCPVRFFWDDLDGQIFACWIGSLKKVKVKT